MAKEVMILNNSDFEAMVPTEAALDCYKFATAMAGVEMDEETEADFIAKRNAKRGWLELAELKSRFEKAAESIKTALKHTFNVGGVDDLPNAKECGYTAKWDKQSYTYEFVEGAGVPVVLALIDKGLVTPEQIYGVVSVSNIVKASGIAVEKLMEMIPDTIVCKPKERKLTIK